MKGEKERFEEWWAIAMGTSMKGSKYLARNAWIAALWEYGVVTMKGELIEASGEKASGAWERPRIPSASELPEEWRKQLSAIDGKPIPPAPTIKQDLRVGPSVEDEHKIGQIVTLIVPGVPDWEKTFELRDYFRSRLSKGVEWERRYSELVEDVSRRTDQARTMEVKK